MRTTRSRSRTVTLSGSYVIATNGVPGAPVTSTFNSVSTCQDSVGRPVVASALNSNQTVRSFVSNGVLTAQGFLPNQVVSISFNSYPPAVTTVGLTTTLLPVPGGWFADVVARTNPSRPSLTPFTLIQDCLELPSMLREVGRLLTKPSKILSPKDLANKNLAVQFGWVPLISDINKLLHLQSLVLKRKKELSRLYSGKGLRRKLEINDDTQFGRYTQTFSFGKGSVTFVTSVKISRKQWATIRWKPAAPYPDVTGDEQLNRLARRLVLGLTPEGLVKGAWDILPWTWLIGWFVGLGNLLLASSNTVAATHSEACFMNEMICDIVPGGVVQSGSGSVALSGFYRQSIKARTVSGVLTPGFNIPLVGISRLSILSSLFVQRFVR